jgi:nicotinate-nucleotide pyrophosphorylase
VCAEETQTLETKIASRAELVVCGMATIPEAVKVFAPNVTVEVKTPDGTLVPKGA